MGRPGELIDGIQKRLDDVEIEATRTRVFANNTLMRLSQVISRRLPRSQNATQSEGRLKKLAYVQEHFRREDELRAGRYACTIRRTKSNAFQLPSEVDFPRLQATDYFGARQSNMASRR
jgi:hypothetical protein